MSALTKIATALALLLGLGPRPQKGGGGDRGEGAAPLQLVRLFRPRYPERVHRETGIRVIYDVMDSSETLEAKLMAGRSGYDLMLPGDTVAERLMRAGSLQPLDKGKLQHLGT